jgi:hypothetical protein
MRRLFVTICLLLVIAAPLEARERRVALVVGNADYEHTTPLRNPQNDAKDLAAALQRLGFDVVSVINGRGAAMADALARFSERLQGADVALFYYAGHGLQFSGRNYALPIDARLDNEFVFKREAFAVDDILASMEAQAKISLVFLDACRNNPMAERLGRSVRGTDRGGTVARGLARMESRGNTLLMYGTAPGDIAEDGEGRNSPFAEALLRHIERPGVDIELALKDVTSDVRQATRNRQRPERLSRLERHFMFLEGAAVGTAAVPALIPAPTAVAASDPGKDDRLFWESIKDSRDPGLFRAYLNKFPTGMFAEIARARLEVRPPLPAVVAAHSVAANVRPDWCRTQSAFNRAEVLICSDHELSRLDLQMQAVHDRVIAGLSGSKRNKFEADNDIWAASRDTCNSTRACILQSYQRRLDELERM